MVTLKNDILSVRISELGAEIKSIVKDEYEYIWQGDPQIWAGSAPILFPLCGASKDGKYILDGKEYNIPQHGFAKFKTFEVESVTDTKAVFLLKEDDETLSMFPFKFEFRAIFTLKKNAIKTEYKVKNLTDDTMYFSVGSHEAFVVPEGIEDYDIIFPKKETLESMLINGPLIQKHKMLIAKNTNVLPMYDKYFLLDTLIFGNLNSKSAILKNRKTERAVKIDFPDADYFLIWHKPSAPYVCLEPWSGMADREDSDYDITKRDSIISLGVNKEYTNTHTVTIL